MALNVETSWSPYHRFQRTFTINLTASIVSCQSCVGYTTFVGNSVFGCRLPHLNWITVQLMCLQTLFYLYCLFSLYLSWVLSWRIFQYVGLEMKMAGRTTKIGRYRKVENKPRASKYSYVQTWTWGWLTVSLSFHGFVLLIGWQDDSIMCRGKLYEAQSDWWKFYLGRGFPSHSRFFTKGKTNFYLFESESFESYDPIRIRIRANKIHLNYCSVISAFHYCPKSILR